MMTIKEELLQEMQSSSDQLSEQTVIGTCSKDRN